MATYQGNALTRNLSGNARPQSSQLAEPVWTDLWTKRVDSILTQEEEEEDEEEEEKEEAQAGDDLSNLSL